MRGRGNSRTPVAPLSPVDAAYTAPAIVLLGTLYELTLHCDKQFGEADGFTFMGAPIVCTTSA